MLAGVISDTHDNLKSIDKASRIFNEHKVNIVIHLGDIIAPFSLERLAKKLNGIKVIGVYGNNCGEKIGLQVVARNYSIELDDPPKLINIKGRKILILHGWGPTDFTKKIAEALLISGKWDAVLYGHTHKKDLRYFSGRLLLNPGEAAGVLYEPSVAILDITTLKARIIPLE